MEQMPAAIVDFAAALKLLGQSQSDVAEIVTKWDLICNTDTPRTVEIQLSNGVHKVDNLAKIRNDLIKGLSLDEPKVKSVQFSAYRVSGRISATDRISNAWHEDGEDPYEPTREGWETSARLGNTDIESVCMPTTPDITVRMSDLRPVIFVGWATGTDGNPITTFDIHIKSMHSAWSSSLYSGKQYYTRTTFVNTNPNGDDVTIKLWYDDTNPNGYFTRVLPVRKSFTVLVWAALGQNLVNIFELKEDIEGELTNG